MARTLLPISFRCTCPYIIHTQLFRGHFRVTLSKAIIVMVSFDHYTGHLSDLRWLLKGVRIATYENSGQTALSSFTMEQIRFAYDNMPFFNQYINEKCEQPRLLAGKVCFWSTDQDGKREVCTRHAFLTCGVSIIFLSKCSNNQHLS